MADGSAMAIGMARSRTGSPRLLEAVGRDRHLVARCAAPGCNRAAPCDPTPWVAEALDGLPLDAFSERLRCVCGSRQARLEVEPGPFELAERPELYIFR